MQNLIAVYDACVFYSSSMRSILLELVQQGLVQGKWTDEIHQEWIRNLLKNRPNFTRDQLERTRRLINEHFEDCLVTNYENLISDLILPDPNDTHVLATAIKSKASIIVTCDLKDFPKIVLDEFSIKAQHPDLFFKYFADNFPDKFLLCIKKIRSRLKNPPLSAEEYLNGLSKIQLHQTVEFLKLHINQI